jgi:hypothetical protein
MKNDLIIDYGDASREKQLSMDQKAYWNYYKNTPEDEFIDMDDPNYPNNDESQSLTFNEWCGTSLHQAGIQALLRKEKLKKINKKADI